jgi:hypothetical protein
MARKKDDRVWSMTLGEIRRLLCRLDRERLDIGRNSLELMWEDCVEELTEEEKIGSLLEYAVENLEKLSLGSAKVEVEKRRNDR